MCLMGPKSLQLHQDLITLPRRGGDPCPLPPHHLREKTDMSRTLHPVLKSGAATALAFALTATTVMPATAMPEVPPATGLPAVSAPAEQPTADPAVATGQEASEVKG